MQKPWNIVCDFDGTIALVDTTDLVLSNFAHADWEIVEQEWKQGKISSAECMRRQIELLSASMAELNVLLDSVEIDPYFAEFAAWCASRHIPMAIASDGVDYFIQRILARHHLAYLPVRANALTLTKQGGFTLDFPYARLNCRSGNCKCVLATEAKTQTVLIGDGQSDFCLAGEADFVIAKKRLLEHCREKNLRHTEFEDFSEVLSALASLINPSSEERYERRYYPA